MKLRKITYSQAILEGFDYLLENYPEVFVIGQGLWSPWYVGETMRNLEKKFGTNRIIDTPVSESACTAAALGASISGMKPIVVHPRMDFMLFATDSIVNEAAKWSFMFGGQSHPSLTIRSIINRGGEQGAQHSQALHSWFAHIPGLRVVMPSTVEDARDLLVSSVLCKDPVIYIDDRWLYSEESEIGQIKEESLKNIGPKILNHGNNLTIVGAGYSAYLALKASKELKKDNIDCEVIDLRIVNPIDIKLIKNSVQKTGRLIVIDGGWKSCSLSSEILALISENVPTSFIKKNPKRITIKNTPAPTSTNLEIKYYPDTNCICKSAKDLMAQ